MAEEEKTAKRKVLRKITPQRLKNIGLYYLKRFESSSDNLRRVLQKRIDEYAYQNRDFDKNEAYQWAEDLICQFEGYGYLNDERYAEIKIRDYLAAGKSARYIKGKLQAKGIGEETVEALLEEQEYDPYELAIKFARKKRIGCFRPDEAQRKECRQKDLAAIVRAGFDYDIARKICGMPAESECSEEF